MAKYGCGFVVEAKNKREAQRDLRMMLEACYDGRRGGEALIGDLVRDLSTEHVPAKCANPKCKNARKASPETATEGANGGPTR